MPVHHKAIPRSWIDYDPEDQPVFEPEVDYLKRYDLLLSGEKVQSQAPIRCIYEVDSMGVYYLKNKV